MSNQYSVILRAQNDFGEKFDLEIIDTPDFLLDISAIELGEIGSVFGISSQNFTLPGNDLNNQFFNNLFDLGTTPAVALNKSVPCQVLVDGAAVFTGKLRVDSIITDEYNDIIYNCVVANETVDFRILTENKGIADLSWAPYSHSYTYASISQSWNDQLFSGSILYPLINYGANPNTALSPGFEFGGSAYQMDNVNTPLSVSQFKPAVQAKTIVDEIFKSINYKYTSSFINSDFFKQLYLLNTPDDQDGLSFVNANSGSYAYATVSQSIDSFFTTATFTQLNYQATVYNNGNNFNVATDTYTADYTGNHILNFNIPYVITSNTGPLVVNNKGRKFILKITKNTPSVTNASTIHTNTTPIPNAVSGVINTGNISVSLTAGDVLYFSIALQTPSSQGIEKLRTVVTAGQNGVYVKVITPQNPIGGTVDVSKVFGDIKILDFMKGLIEKFNLVIEPVPNRLNILRIEPYNDWISLGNTVDWTDIVDRSVKFQITHPIQSLPKKFRFSDDLDDDVLNQYQYDNSGKVYGEQTYQTDSDLASGERQIGGFFAATPVKGLPTKNVNGTTVVPWLVTQEQGKYVEPFKFKPRLLHKTPIKTIPNNEMYGTTTGSFSVPTGSTFYYIADPQNNGVRALNFYRTLLPTTDSPTNFSSSLDLHYNNLGYVPFQQSAVNGRCQDGLYNRYWAYYINSLYDIDARLLTCNVVLDPSDIELINLNDKIFIDGHYYRINKIQGANLFQRQSTQCELVKLLPRNQPYTGRRRISTGIGPTEFKDVIINGFQDNGSVFYSVYETDEPETDPFILSQAAALDGYEAYDTEVSWNTQEQVVVNPNIIVLGNSKYNETQQNVISIGAGNILQDNISNVSIFGNDNTVSSGYNDVFLIANSASIVDSNEVVLIQPSGSRIISGSTNNVVINPINDIIPSDPTGSVYTGNLRNQGTADFKQGATMTGSVNITGSLTVNGVPIVTGSSTIIPNVLFNHSFGVDPASETFVTIPNVTGTNRAFQFKYILTSGSTAINAGQLQVIGDGTSAGSVNIINQQTLTGAPTASFTATYNVSDLDVKASFIGTSYIMSGSYNSFI